MADEESHILRCMPIRARLGRSTDYRDNGRAELAANADKRMRVYDNDAKIIEYLQHYDVSPRVRSFPKHGPAHAALYHFGCFTTGQEPYSNIAHHLVPCEVFIPEEVFTDDELEILKRVPYDVNNGKNIIFLPGFSQAVEVYLLKRGGVPGSEMWDGLGDEAKQRHREAWKQRSLRYCNVHRLPCHYDFHKDYTALVKKRCTRLKRLVRGQLGKVCASWRPPESIPQELFRLQDEYWEHVVTFGERRPLGAGANINELVEVKPSKDKLSL